MCPYGNKCSFAHGEADISQGLNYYMLPNGMMMVPNQYVMPGV